MVRQSRWMKIGDSSIPGASPIKSKDSLLRKLSKSVEEDVILQLSHIIMVLCFMVPCVGKRIIESSKLLNSQTQFV